MEQSQQNAADSSDVCATLVQESARALNVVMSLQIQEHAPPSFELELAEQLPRDVADEVEALEQQARELARVVESSRIQTLHQSDEKIEALGQRARDLANSVETARLRTLKETANEIEAMGRQARDLANSVEATRLQTLRQTDNEIEAMGQQARDLARSVETSRVQTLNQTDCKIDELGRLARELARSVETSRIKTLMQSDGKIEALGQQARVLATFVETARIQALNHSNKEIRKLNEGLEQRVCERTAQLEVANKELDSFSYSISHDLRAPLRAIDGFSRIVLEEYSEPLAAEGKAYLKLVRDNTQQMGRLVDDLLAFARLGRQPLTKQVIVTSSVVKQCLEDMKKEQEGRNIEIVVGELPSSLADPGLLKQVWTNLISNALKYTRRTEHARVEIGANVRPRTPDGEHSPDDKPQVVYFVQDNGAGFDMTYANKLFGVFQRLHRASEYEGTGVGLAIVQRIVQRHGGQIWGKGVPNEGATFSFTLN